MPRAGHLVELRTGLAAFVGQRVHARAVVMKGGVARVKFRWVPQTLLGFVAVEELGWAKVGYHAWVRGSDFVCDGLALPGDEVEFTAEVTSYPGTDPASGRPITRYGLTDAEGVRSLGPALLREMIGELVSVFGWEAVANAVEGHHAD